MTTTKSYSNSRRMFSMYISSLKGQLPFLAISTIFMLIAIPITLYAALRGVTPTRGMFAAGIYPDAAQSGMIAALLMVIGLVTALFAHRHMHSKRMTDLYHSLPIDRPRLLLAGTGASLTAVLLPYTVLYFLSFFTEQLLYAKYNIFWSDYYQFVAMDYICTVLFVAIVYVFTVFVAVHVGTTFDTVAITGVLGFLPMLVYLIGGAVWSTYTYGSQFTAEYAVKLSPFTFMFERYGYVAYDYTTMGESFYSHARYDYGKVALLMGVWTLIGAALLVGAVYFYNRRKSELAEQTQPRGVFQVVVKCFAAFCGSAMFLAIFNEQNAVGQVFFMLLGAVIVGAVAELILSRGVRHLLRNLALLAGTGAVFCVLVYAVRLDLFGYIRRVPDITQVQSIRLSYGGRYANMNRYYSYGEKSGIFGDIGALTDPESIATVREMHRLAVSDYPGNADWNRYSTYVDNMYPYQYMTLEYRLKNGSTLQRTYNRMNVQALNTLVLLEDKPDFIKATNPLFLRLPNLSLDTPQMFRSVSVVPLLGAGAYETNVLGEADMALLVGAMREDILAESLEDITTPKQPALGHLVFRFKDMKEIQSEYGHHIQGQLYYYFGGEEVAVVLPAHYTRTIAALRQLGLYDRLTEKNADDIEHAYFANLRYYQDNSRYNTLRTISPLYQGEFSYFMDKVSNYNAAQNNQNAVRYPDDDWTILGGTSNPADIRQVFAAGKTQLLLTPNSAEEVAWVMYEANDQIIGRQYVRIADLPAGLQQQVRQSLKEIEGMEYNTSYPEMVGW